MKRIVIVGGGYQAGKAARTAKRIYPDADLVWITDYDQRKYPLSLLAMLLNSGAGMGEWSRIRAGIKVGFENHQKSINHFPLKVRKIRIDPQASELSFLTGIGTMSYSFDRVLIFPGTVVRHDGLDGEDEYVWPGDSCVQYLAASWESMEDPVVVGRDMSLVQAFVSSRKKFTWVRTGSVFSSQVQHFLDQGLERLGVKVVEAHSWSGTEGVSAEGKPPGRVGKTVFYCGQCFPDLGRLKAYGLKAGDPLDSDRGQGRVTVIDWNGLPEGCPAGHGPEAGLAGTLKQVEAALKGGNVSPKKLNARFWNMGKLSSVRVGIDMDEARKKDFDPEFALIHGMHDLSADKPYVLQLVMDRPTQKIIGLEAVGEKAHEWANAVSSLMLNDATLDDVLNLEMIWTDAAVNPMTRCAAMLKNKVRGGVLGITPEELQQSSQEGADFFLLDVRGDDEFCAGRIPGAGNIPLSQLKNRATEIPRFTPIVLYSQSSGRAYEAARLLRSMGARQLYVLDGGFGLYTLEKDLSPPCRMQSGAGQGCSLC